MGLAAAELVVLVTTSGVIKSMILELALCGGRSGPVNIDQDLSYGKILAGRPGAWLVNKKFLCMQSKKLRRELMLKLKMISIKCLIFMIAFTVYE